MNALRISPLLLAPALLFAQSSTVRTTVPLVILPACVTDQKGQPVYGLTEDDFVVLDEGQPRPAHVEASDSVSAPLELVVLVQTNDVARSALLKVKKMGGVISQALAGANAQVAVITYGDEVRVVQAFTSDADATGRVFVALKPSDDSRARMLDAVETALGLLQGHPGTQRPTILVIGESRDRGSETKLADAIERAQRDGVTVHTLSYSSYLTPFTTKASEYEPSGGSYIDGIRDLARLGRANTVEALTSGTGGSRKVFETKSGLERDLLTLSKDLHSRYLISFTPDHEREGQFHKVQVTVKGRPDLVVRVRPGYWGSSADAER